MKTRYLEPAIREDVNEKMVFLGGPRLAVGQRFQVVQQDGVDYVDKRTDVRTISANRFLTALV